MNKKTNTLITIITGILGVSGLGLLLWSILDDNASRWVLTAALACVAVGLFFSSWLIIQKHKSAN